MTAYFILILLSVGIMQIYERAKDDLFNKNRKLIIDYCIIFTILSFVLFFGFRAYSVGTDTMNYLKKIFTRIEKLSLNYVEPLYLILNIFIAKLGGNYTSLLILLGFIIFIPLVISIAKLSNKPSISMFLFITLGMFCQSMNAMRQYIALVYILLGVTFLLKQKRGILFFVGFIALATLFHRTAVVCLILIPIKYIKLNLKNFLIAGGCLVVSLLCAPYVIKLFDIIMGTKYSIWYASIQWQHSLITTISVICVLFLCTIILYKCKNIINKHDEKKYDFFCWMFIVFSIIKIISMFSIELIDRVGTYFMISTIFIVPIITNKLSNKLQVLANIAMGLVLSVFFILLIQTRGTYGAFPYLFI